MNTSDELSDILDDLGASARSHELFQENKMGIDEVTFLNPDHLLRYKIHAEGDRIVFGQIRLIQQCRKVVKHRDKVTGDQPSIGRLKDTFRQKRMGEVLHHRKAPKKVK